MSLTVAELADEVRETNRRLADAVQGLRADFSQLRNEVATTNNSLSWVIRIGTSLVACMLAILTFAYRVDQRATRTEEAVVALQANFAEFKTDFKARDKQLADSLTALQTNSQARDDRLDRVLNSLDRIEKILTKGRPANPE